MPETPIQRFQSIWESIWEQIHIDIDENQTPNPQQGVWGGHKHYASVGQTGFFSLGEATSLGEGKLWIQTC